MGWLRNRKLVIFINICNVECGSYHFFEREIHFFGHHLRKGQQTISIFVHFLQKISCSTHIFSTILKSMLFSGHNSCAHIATILKSILLSRHGSWHQRQKKAKSCEMRNAENLIHLARQSEAGGQTSYKIRVQ